jgi:hypothetical protein
LYVRAYQGFKDYCAPGFFQGALAEGPKKLLAAKGLSAKPEGN